MKTLPCDPETWLKALCLTLGLWYVITYTNPLGNVQQAHMRAFDEM